MSHFSWLPGHALPSIEQEGSQLLQGQTDTYQHILLLPLPIPISVLPLFPYLQLLLLLLPLILLCFPLLLSLGAVRRPHGRIPRQRSREIREDEVPRLVPQSQCQYQGVRSSIEEEGTRKRKLIRTIYPGSDYIGGCPSTRYTKSRTTPVSSRGGSIASLMRCTTSEGESAPSASAVPSSDASGAIVCRGSACLISGATLCVW